MLLVHHEYECHHSPFRGDGYVIHVPVFDIVRKPCLFSPEGRKALRVRSLSRSFFQSGSIVLDLGPTTHKPPQIDFLAETKAAFFRPTSTDPWSWRAGKEIWGLQGTFPIENWLLCLSLSRSPRFPRVTQICFTLHLPFYYSPLSLIPSRLYAEGSGWNVCYYIFLFANLL